MFEWFYTIVSFIIGLIGGAAAIMWKHRDYIKIAVEDFIDAYKDGKIEFKETVKIIIDAYATYSKKDPKQVANETITYLKEKYGIQ